MSLQACVVLYMYFYLFTVYTLRIQKELPKVDSKQWILSCTVSLKPTFGSARACVMAQGQEVRY